MKPAGIHHVSINVSDLAVARDFYVGTLGCDERSDRPTFDVDGAWLDVGGQQVHLIVAEPPVFLGQHFAMLVDDVATAVEELRTLGIRVSGFKSGTLAHARDSTLTRNNWNTLSLNGLYRI